MRNPPMSTSLEEARALVARAERIVTFSGAGLSRASGIPTYRDEGGLWTKDGNLRFSSAEAFAADPEGFLAFWAARRAELARAEPNAAHRALAALERLRPDVCHATQNVDGLLARAGCRRVHELHGSLSRYRCDACGGDPFAPADRCPRCGALARPDVVMFGEMLPAHVWAEAEGAAMRCEVMLVVGTSAVVRPAASLVEKAAARGARVVVVNPGEGGADGLADIVLRGTAEAMLPQLVDGLAA